MESQFKDEILRTLLLTGASIWKLLFSGVLLCELLRASCCLLISVPVFSISRIRGRPCSFDVYLTMEAIVHLLKRIKSKTKDLKNVS